MGNKLEGKTIAVLATDGFEQVELTRPREALEAEGATVELISLESGPIRGYNHLDAADEFDVDLTINEVDAADYDGLCLPGGLANPDALRMNNRAVGFVRQFFSLSKPVAAICHAPWVLIEAGVVEGRKLTSWPSLKTDVLNAGGNWQDTEVCVDNGLVTSRKPDDLDAFCRKAVEEFCEGEHVRQTA